LHDHRVAADHHDVAGAEFLCGLHKTVLYEISSFKLCSTAYGASGLGADHTPAPGCAAIVPRLRRRPLDNRLF
jgi:hypothetical protein